MSFKKCCYSRNKNNLNHVFLQAGQSAVSEAQLERVIQELEVNCWQRIQAILKNEEGLGIEYDENVICDVCRSVSSSPKFEIYQ